MNADDEALALARRAFQLARSGDAAGLSALLKAGMPVGARNENGDSWIFRPALETNTLWAISQESGLVTFRSRRADASSNGVPSGEYPTIA